uniref:Uncharacterized protein n=1 Tax=Mus spicilegus TaxID=10103 RepID=A0A8C6HZX5_MUSSI
MHVSQEWCLVETGHRHICINFLLNFFSMKWFQQQVNQMEEISKDQSNLEELQSDGKTASLNIVQIAKLARKFEDIKSRLKKRKEVMQTKKEDKEIMAETLKHYGLMEKQIEEFITSHSALESQTETESQSALEQPSDSPGTPSVTTRMARMIKIFENQSTMLEKALNDQHTIESKYKQMETDLQVLIMEKTLLEGEIRRLREIEKVKSAAKEEQTKKSGKSEKKKFKEKEKYGMKICYLFIPRLVKMYLNHGLFLNKNNKYIVLNQARI